MESALHLTLWGIFKCWSQWQNIFLKLLITYSYSLDGPRDAIISVYSTDGLALFKGYRLAAQAPWGMSINRGNSSCRSGSLLILNLKHVFYQGVVTSFTVNYRLSINTSMLITIWCSLWEWSHWIQVWFELPTFQWDHLLCHLSLSISGALRSNFLYN